jgi:hypothetical protein
MTLFARFPLHRQASVVCLEPVEALVDRGKVGIEPGESFVHLDTQTVCEPQDVRQHHLSVEPGQDRNELFTHGLK